MTDAAAQTPRPTPLADVAEPDGPTWVAFCGWKMAVQFESVIAEHLAVRRHAGLFDVSHMGRLRIDGPDADAAVERLLTRRTGSMTPDAIRYSFIANDVGDILDDLMVARCPDGWQLVVNAANRERVVAQIEAAGFGSLLRDLTLETAMFAVQGPEAADRLAKVWPESRATERKRYRRWTAERDGAELVGSRSGYTGEDGFEIYGPPEAVARLWADLREAGVAPCGLGARDSLRNEAALPLYGHELTESASPWELGLAYAVDLETDFIGRDELARRHDADIRRKRTGLVMAGRRFAREGMTVNRDGREVGTVTSGTWSPLREQPIAQAYLDTDVADAGGSVEVDVRGRPEQAEIVALGDLLQRG